MIHVLDFDSNIIDFISNDDNNVIRAEYKRDADSELLDIIMLSQRAEHFKKRNRVIIQDKNGIYREFIIVRVEDEGQYVTIECNASYLHDIASAKPILAGKYEKTTVNDKLSEVLKDTGWTVGDCDYAGIRTMSWTSTQTPYEMIKLIETNHSLKASYEIIINSNEVVERKVNMREPVALFKGKEIVYGKDLLNMKRTIDFSEVKTALLALGPENGKGQRISTVVVDDEAQEQFNLPQRYIWGIYEPESNEQNMTLERLTTLATTELNKRKSASISYEISVADIEEEYSHEVVRYGDLVRIKNNDFTPSLYAESEVIGFTHDLISDDCTYTFGRIVEYKEDDLLKYFRSKLDNFNQKLIDNISNVNTIVQETLDTELQHYEKKIIKSDTPPTNAVNDVFWLDTSNPNVPILKRYWEGQWIKASVDNVEDIGGITREKALFSELSNTFINLTIQHSKLLNEMHEVMNSEYLVDEDIKKSLNINLDKTVTVFNNIKTNLESMNEDTATIGKLVDTQALFLKYREQLQALYKVVEQAKLSIDARFKLLQAQYTDEKFNEAMENVAKTLPNGKWNADTKILTSDVPNQDKLDSIVNDLKLFVNNQDNALETKIGKSVDAKIVDTKNEFTRKFTEVDSKVDKLNFENRNLLENSLNTFKRIDESFNKLTQLFRIDISHVSPKLKIGDVITVSFDVQMEKGTILKVYDSNGQIDKSFGVATFTNIGTDKKRLSFTKTLKNPTKVLRNWYMDFYNDNDPTNRFTIERVKLELGAKATPYSIAPEDIDKSINDITVRVETVEGGLTATNKKFETVYSKTETEKLLNSSLEPIKADVNSTKSSITQLDKEIKTKVSQTTYTIDQANVVQRLNSADSERNQLSNQIADRVTLTEYNNGIEAIENDTDQKLTNMKTEVLQDGKQIAQTVSSEVFNVKAKTLNKVLSQYINDTVSGHQFTYDENGNISNFSVGSSGIKFNSKMIDLNDGDLTIQNGVSTIKDAYIPKLFSKKATIEYLDAIGITARTLQAGDKQASVNIENGSITMNRDTGARMDIGLDGIQSFNNGGSLRFSLTPTLVTTSAVGTSVSNVYLGAAPTGEARVVDMNGIPGDGAIGSYAYRPIRTLAIKFPLKANGYIGIDGNELRIMSDGLNDGGFKNIRADKGYFATVDMNNEINGTHFYIRPKRGGELRTTYNDGGDTSYANFRSDGIYAPWIDYNGHIPGSHFYIRPAYGGEVRLTATGTTNNWASLRSDGIYVPWIDFNGQIPGSHLYIRPGSGGEVRFTKTGTTDQFINIRANDGDFNQISYNKWVQKSREEWKTGIRKWEVNASEVLTNEVDIYEFYYKNDLDYLTRGSVIGDGYKVPDFWLSKSKNGIDNTSVIWTLAKALQEQIEKNNKLENKINIIMEMV
ncbi:phage tail spike protein [Macrococcus caseolyticus]|uniref:phage tail spike protein n=1 Tax=Macrococcoides caseolyticum TaxID=69966 RepID=UPI0024BCAF44|nr:phage tail spike protein [Macrococcus caseolyticus]MDJ1108605.1 phage tail spike protein [Macrococcus caseolyticus]